MAVDLPVEMPVQRLRPPLASPPSKWLAAASTAPADRLDANGWYQRAQAADSESTRMNALRLPVKHLSAAERQETDLLTCRSHASPAAPVWSVMVKADSHVVTHTGIVYRVIHVGETRIPVGGLTRVMTVDGSRGHGFARAAVASAVSFVGLWLWAPFAVVICPRGQSGYYERLGWRVIGARLSAQEAGSTTTKRLDDDVTLILPCQDVDTAWPNGDIDLCGVPW